MSKWSILIKSQANFLSILNRHTDTPTLPPLPTYIKTVRPHKMRIKWLFSLHSQSFPCIILGLWWSTFLALQMWGNAKPNIKQFLPIHFIFNCAKFLLGLAWDKMMLEICKIAWFCLVHGFILCFTMYHAYGIYKSSYVVFVVASSMILNTA